MAKCQYLEGENVRPHTATEARKLIGKQVEFLRGRDIDRSGRGYFWPRKGTVTEAIGRNIEIGGNWESLASLVEVVVLPEKTE